LLLAAIGGFATIQFLLYFRMGADARSAEYAPHVNRVREEVLARCPSLSLAARRNISVMRTPGSIDVVITAVNFTTSLDKRSKFYREYPVDTEHHYCNATGTTAMEPWDRNDPIIHRCDHLKERPCCVKSASSKEWGTCVAPDLGNAQCNCRDCYDFRTRRRALLFNEVRLQLRSFENNGLHIKSAQHPDGLLRKIFIIYNDGTQNGAPSFLDPQNPHVIAVPHKVLFEAHAAAGGSMEGHPTGNRNAIAALIPFVPDLGDWILYLEDDMFLTRPLSNKYHDWVTESGLIVSHETRTGLMNPDAGYPGNGYLGAMWNTGMAMRKVFGKRSTSSTCLVKGMEDVVIGSRSGEEKHGPRLFNRCALQELWRRWPRKYAETVKTVEQEESNFDLKAHHNMFMDELGFGINVAETPNVVEVHTNQPYPSSSFVHLVCSGWKDPRKFWVQVQGDGISDEYHKKKWPWWKDLPIRSPQGDVRWAWMAMAEKFWKFPSVHEVDHFGDKVYDDLKLSEDGERLCPGKQTAVSLLDFFRSGH